jgi:hypothetical protein
VTEAIELQNTGKKGWVTGYIVGAVAPGITEVSGNADIEWEAPTTLDNTLVIAPSADVRDYSKCIAVALPQGSSFRRDASLKDFPELLGTQIWVKGTLATFMEMAGITDNTGSIEEYKLSIMTGGVTELYEDFESCNKNGSMPDGWRLMKTSGDKDWYIDEFDSNKYAAVTGYTGKQPPFEAWLITPALDIKNAGRKEFSFMNKVRYYRGTDPIEVYLMSTNDPTTAELIKLEPTLATAADGGQSDFISSGVIDLSQYEGTYCIGFCYKSQQQSNYTTWQLDNFKFGGKALLQTIDDFETMDFYKSGTTPYGAQEWRTLTSTKGWTATNASMFMGGPSDASPVFAAIGKKADGSDNWAYAVHLDGGINNKGVLVSPVISGGIKTLTLSYGYFFTESNGVQFRVTLTSGGQIVKQFDVKNTTAEQKKAYTHTETCNVSGDVQISIQSLSPSNGASKKDRFAVWNIMWENM